MNAWDRQPGEPGHWFDRFEVFRQLGPKRDMLSAYRSITGRQGADDLPGNWRDATTKWRWRERAEAFDDDERRKQREAEEEMRAEERQYRLQMLRASRQIIGRELANYAQDETKLKETSFGGIMAALQMVMREQRTEFGEASVITRQEQTGAGGGPVASVAVNQDEEAELLSVLDLEDVQAIKAIRAKARAKLLALRAGIEEADDGDD